MLYTAAIIRDAGKSTLIELHSIATVGTGTGGTIMQAAHRDSIAELLAWIQSTSPPQLLNIADEFVA